MISMDRMLKVVAVHKKELLRIGRNKGISICHQDKRLFGQYREHRKRDKTVPVQSL